MPPRTSEPSVGEEEEQCATPTRTQVRGGQDESRGRSPTPRPIPDSTSSESTTPPLGIPSEPAGAGESPEAVGSSTSLGSTPLDRERAEEPAEITERAFKRLREHVKKTRTCLLHEVDLREALDEKLSGRILDLTDAVSIQKEMIFQAMEQMRLDFQVELEQAKEEIRGEFESLLDPIKCQILEVASQAQEGVNEAVQHGM